MADRAAGRKDIGRVGRNQSDFGCSRPGDRRWYFSFLGGILDIRVLILHYTQHAGGEASGVKITQASPKVRKILDATNFGKLFKFSRVCQ